MEKETTGTVVSVARQWWLKVNTRIIRTHPSNGTTYPHIIKVSYTADGNEYTCKKWVKAGVLPPAMGSLVQVFYLEEKPAKVRIEF